MNACRLSSASDSVIRADNNRVCVIRFATASPTDCRASRITNHESVRFRSVCTQVTHFTSPSAPRASRRTKIPYDVFQSRTVAVPYCTRWVFSADTVERRLCTSRDKVATTRQIIRKSAINIAHACILCMIEKQMFSNTVAEKRSDVN